MLKDLQTVLETQHRLLDSLLLEAVRQGDRLDDDAYAAFRETLRQHISLEERLILKSLRDVGYDYPMAPQLHDEHAAFGRLIVAPPTLENAIAIGQLLRPHEAMEESEVGLFAVANRTLDDATLKRLVKESSLKRGDISIFADEPQTREDAFALAAERDAAHKPPKP